MSTSASAILAALRKISPNISFSTRWTPDRNFVWDGDGPDPAEEGYTAYDVAVYARVILNGQELEGVNYLGGSYSKPPHDPDVHGYLPQMLREAVEDLERQIRGPLLQQAKAAKKYLTDAMRRRYTAENRRRR